MTSNYGVTDLAAMTAGFPSKTLTIREQPTLRSLLECLKHIIACSMTKRLPTAPLGHLYQAVPVAVYALHTADAYPIRAIDPGQQPTFVGPEADIARRNIENTFAVAYKLTLIMQIRVSMC